jgi:hypothetical protein
MEPLIFKIETQADDSGVRKFDKSVGGLDVSSRKASGALKSFAQDIAQARDGSDVASAALGAFSRILGSSLAATGVVIAVKTVVDGFSKIEQAVKESEKAVADAFAGMESSGKALTFADAVGQAKTFEGVAKKITEEIKKINESPMLNIIDGLMQSTDRMRELAKQSEDQAIAIRKAGAESELAHLSRIKGLDAEGKALAANERALEKELEGIDAIKEASTALAVTQKYAMQADEIRAKFADERGKAEAELATQKQKQLDDTIKKEKELGEAQQKRFNELYDAEVKSQEQMQKRIDAELKAEEAKAARQQELQQNLAQAQESQKQNTAAQASSIASSMSGGSQSVEGGQRKTSYEVGLEKAQERAFVKGRRDAADAEIQRKIDQIKQERAAVGDTRFTGKTDAMNRMAEEAVKAAEAQGKASYGTNEMAKSVETAQSELSNFSDTTSTASYETDTFSTNLSDLGTDFDSAMNSADTFSRGLTENSGNMIDDFLNTGKESDELGKDFNKTSDEVNRFGEAVKKNTPPPSKDRETGKGSKSGDPLTKIHQLLEDNLKEMRTYAFVK